MTKSEKRLLKLRQNPKNVTKEELDAVLADFGFESRGGKGSHNVYKHPDQDAPLVVAVHGKHVPVYIVKQVIVAIDQLLSSEKEKDDDN